MSKRPWYKRYPGDFLAGTMNLTAEQKGVYSVLLDLMYDRRRPLDDNAQELGRICGCSTRRFNVLKNELVALGKINLADGKITNPRFEKQSLSEDLEHDKSEINGRNGGVKSAEKRAAPKENNEIDDEGLGPQNQPVSDAQTLRKKERDTSYLSSERQISGEAILSTRKEFQFEESSPPLILTCPESASTEQRPPESRPTGTALVPIDKPRISPALNCQIVEIFDQWWAAYPLKKSKDGARKKYADIVKAGRATESQLLEGAKRYATERMGQEARYTKHPTTWLNNGCWDDEPPQSGGPAPFVSRSAASQHLFQKIMQNKDLS